MGALQDILISELDNKKVFDCLYDSDCDGCGDSIMEGDTFYFMGNKQKVCEECLKELRIMVESI